MKIGISQKIILLFIILVVILTASIGTFFVRRERSILLSEFDQRSRILLSSAATNIEYPLLVGDLGALNKIGEGILKQRDVVFYSIVDKEGKVVLWGGAEKEKNARKYSISIISERQAGTEDLVLGSQMKETEEIGRLFLSLSINSLTQKIKDVSGAIALLVIVGIILASFFINLLVKFVLGRPISILLKGIEKISGGNLSYKFPLTSQDEIGTLATSFNKMTQDLQKTTVSVKVLGEEQKRFQDVTQSTEDWIWEIDDQGKYVYVNSVIEEILGYRAEEITGKYFYEFYHPDEQEALKKIMFETFTRHESFKSFLSRNIRKDGEIVIIESTGLPKLNEDGRLLGYRGAGRDITERKRAEEELRAAYEELKHTQAQLVQSAKMASVGVLAGGVAHEINNPLTGVLNNVQLIKMIADQKKDFSIDEFKELLALIEESAQRCTKITRSLLSFSRASKGVLQPVSLNEMVDRVMILVEHELKLENITIQRETFENLPLIKGDAQLLQQIIFDTITNSKWAIQKKSQKGGGVITIKTDHEPGSHFISLYLSDNGIGIPKENLERIFEPFFTTKPVGEGTGLGLSIVYNIIKEHNGTIAVESEPGERTTFKITLPIVAAAK